MFPILNFFIKPNNINGAKDKKNEKINKSCSQLKLYLYLRNWVIRKEIFGYMNEIDYSNLLHTHTCLL